LTGGRARITIGSMSAVREELRSVLDELDAWLRSRHLGLHRCLRPGLSSDELDRLGRELLPYHLPAELEELYRWHDGWERPSGDERAALLPDAEFAPLAEAIRHHRAWWDALGADGWHPLWFPAFGSQSGELVPLQLEPRLPAGQVYAYHSELDLSTSYDSVTTLFATALDLWRRGLLPGDTAYPEIRRIIGALNPRSRTRDGTPLREISRSSTRDWPASWKQALAIAPMIPAADDEVVTIAELTAGRAGGHPIRAEMKGIGGSGDRFLATASDATGSATVFLMRDGTENFREASGSGRYDLWLAPLLESRAANELTESLRPFAGVGSALYLVTKVVPL
jgi:cell wall assembly regulator SMI1